MCKQTRLGVTRAADFRNRTTPARGGEYCPRCSGSELLYGKLQSNGVQSWCSVECGDCYSSWEVRYTLTLIEDADSGTPHTKNAA